MPRGDQVTREQRTLGKTDHARTCVRVTLAQPEPHWKQQLSPGPSYATWSAASLEEGSMPGGGEGSLRRWLWAGSSPINTCRPRGQVSQRQPHTMGRWELAVLGLACCLAVASGAKVSERPAEGSAMGGSPLSPSLSQTWNLGTGTSRGKTESHWQNQTTIVNSMDASGCQIQSI